MFGSIMRFTAPKSGLSIEMAPLTKQDMPEFIKNGGMQSREVLQFLSRWSAPVEEDEFEWFEKIRNSNDDLMWGIYVVDGDKRILIGCTGLHGINGTVYNPYKTATSGFLIFRQEYWGKGIAGACHRARTMFAFDVLGLVMIRSAVVVQNVASRKALESVGYVVHHRDRLENYHLSEPREDYRLWCVNPDKYVAAYWWRGKEPKTYRLARAKTAEAVEWARSNVTY